MIVDLPPPPSYEYETIGPWFVTQVTEGTPRAWTMWSFRAAVLRFWCVEDGRADPERRTLIDGNGVMIHGIDRSAGPGTKMVSTRECFDLLLAEAEKNPEADVVEILRMIDTLQASNGSVQ